MRLHHVLAALLVGAVFMALSTTTSTSSTDLPEAHWAKAGCKHSHPSVVARKRIRAVLTRLDAYTRAEGRRVRHYATCVATIDKARAGHRLIKRLRAWREQYAQVWRIRFNKLPAWSQAWARSTSSCESHMNPAAHNPTGLYHGAFQFLLSTWWSAGGTGDPHLHSWHYQAVVAVRWMYAHGDEQWPVCGD